MCRRDRPPRTRCRCPRAQRARRFAPFARRSPRAGGCVPFARYMELALYAPGLGYYAAGATKLGAAGDFVTAPEMTPLYAACAGDAGRGDPRRHRAAGDPGAGRRQRPARGRPPERAGRSRRAAVALRDARSQRGARVAPARDAGARRRGASRARRLDRRAARRDRRRDHRERSARCRSRATRRPAERGIPRARRDAGTMRAARSRGTSGRPMRDLPRSPRRGSRTMAIT